MSGVVSFRPGSLRAEILDAPTKTLYRAEGATEGSQGWSTERQRSAERLDFQDRVPSPEGAIEKGYQTPS